LALSGCVYYGDIHGHSDPVSPCCLMNKHVYRVPHHTMADRAAWWHRFHDPQLDQLINVALCHSPTMKQAEARIRLANSLADAAATSLWPSIDFSGYVQRQRFSQFGLAPPPFNGRTFNIGTLAFNFNYEFDFWGKNRELLASRISEVCAAEADDAQARLVLSAAVAGVYFQLLGDIKAVQLTKRNLEFTREISAIVVDRAKNGIESDIPVKSAVADTEGASLVVEKYKQLEALARNQLAVLLGDNAMATQIKTRPFTYHVYHVHLPACLPANLLAHRPDIYASRSRVEAAAHLINVTKARFFPDINLNGLFSYQSVGLGHLFDRVSQNNAITGAVDLPIFDAGLRRAELRSNYAEYDLAVNQYNQTILTALREVADQAATLKALRAQLRSENNALLATQRNDHLFMSRYQHGVIDYVPVLEMREVLVQQQITQLNLEVNQLRAVVDMIKALGGVTG